MSTRACLWCATPFPVPANNPHRRFCSPRCRVADWHYRHDRPPGATADTSASKAEPHRANAVPAPNVVPTPNAGNAAGSARCPHCHRPLAVLTVLVPPAAAVVAVPPAPQTDLHDPSEA